MRPTLSVEEGMRDPGSNPIKRLRHPGPDPDQVFAARERRKILAQTLRHLPADFKQALYLCYVKGLSVRDAASTLGVNQQTFKVRLFRGRRKLARSLVAHHHGGHFASFRIYTERSENGDKRGSNNIPTPEALPA